MVCRDLIDRIRYGGVREAATVLREARDRALKGPGRFVTLGIAVAAIVLALFLTLRSPQQVFPQNAQAAQFAQNDRATLMAMSPTELAAEEERRAAVAAAAGDDDADFATESLERVRQVQESRARSLGPVGTP